MPVYLIRHTEKEEDRKKFPVDAETPLSDLGVAHAVIVAQHLAEDIVKRGGPKKITIRHSTAKRAVQTAEPMVPALEKHGIIVTLQPDRMLIDKNHGTAYSLNQQERDALFAQGGVPVATQMSEAWRKFQMTMDHHPHAKLVATPPEGENWYDLLKRVRHPCNDMRKVHTPEENTAVVAHSGSLCAAARTFLNKTEFWFLEQPIPNFGSIRRLDGTSWNDMQDSGLIYAGTAKKGQPSPQTQGEIFNAKSQPGGQFR